MAERPAVDQRPRVKICGVTRNRDALRAEDLGADLIGVVLTAGFGRSVDSSVAGDVVAGTGLERVAVLVDETPDAAARLASGIGASVLQLHGDESPATVRALRGEGDWRIWKAVRARSPDDIRRLVDGVGEIVDGILVEGWRSGVVGGGGARLELEAEAVRELIPEGLDFVLAGGLTPELVGAAVARFRPDVVDVSSGVERTVGVKSDDLVEAFIRAARAAPRAD